MSQPQILPWRRRGDIVARPRRASGRGGWVLKDPVSLRYFTFRDEEYFVWTRLNGAAAIEELCRSFAEQFAPQQLSSGELQKFVAQLIGQGLVVADGVGSAATTASRRTIQTHWQRLARLNPLAIRFRGIDPDRFLDHLLPWCGGLFSWPGVLVGVVLVVSALTLWSAHAAEFARLWPEEVAQWTVNDIWSFAAVLIVVKVLHELGHALTCKRFGGEVHELGVLLLVGTPCLYCNVSDAWLLPSKWQRIAIGAAGMWVETVLSAVCAWLWWFSAPGWFHSTCSQIVLVCGVSTLLFNMNPLLRYDGYYILSDWTEVPNLQQQSWSELMRQARGWLTGDTPPPPPALSTRMRFWLPAYAVASLKYRVMMVFAILWFLYRWLEPQGLGQVAQVIAMFTVVAMMAGPVSQARQGWLNRQGMLRFGTAIRLGIALVGLAALLWLPLPCRIRAPIVVEPTSAQRIYVTVDGELDRIAAPGTELRTGDEIARLVNSELEREIARLEGELGHATVMVQNLERRRLHDPQATLQLPGTRQLQADVEEQLRQRRAEAERLVLKAPRAGTLWPVHPREKVNELHELHAWSDSPFDAHNAHCWLTAGTLLAHLGSGKDFEAIAYLPQRDVPALEPGQTVRVQLDAAPGRVFSGAVAEVSVMQAESLSESHAVRLRLPIAAGPTGARLVGTWYQVRIRLADVDTPRLSQATGVAAIVVAPQSLAQRIATWLRETFPGVSSMAWRPRSIKE